MSSSNFSHNHFANRLQLWDLIEGSPLFKVDVPERVYEYDDQQHLGMITALLGDSPQSLLKQGDRTSLFYNVEGMRANAIYPESESSQARPSSQSRSYPN